MKHALSDPLLLTLAALLGLTLASWALQAWHGPDPRWIGAAVLAIAFVKARLIVVHYMEAKHAALPIRVAFEAWVWGSAAVVLALY